VKRDRKLRVSPAAIVRSRHWLGRPQRELYRPLNNQQSIAHHLYLAIK